MSVQQENISPNNPAYRDYTEAIQLINTLHHVGHNISQANVDYLMSRIDAHVRNIIEINGDAIFDRAAAMLRIPPRHLPTEKPKLVFKKKLEECCPTECAICQESPKYKDAICTDCKHYYCKECWNTWMNAAGSNKSCPTCRNNVSKTTYYTSRVCGKPKRITIEYENE